MDRMAIWGSKVAIAFFLGGGLPAIAVAATRVDSIEFKGDANGSTLDIKADAPLVIDKQENSQDKQIVLELKDTTLSKTALQKLDTSSFPGNVSLVSPYQVKENARIVIQLRDAGSAAISQNGNVSQVVVAAAGAPVADPAAQPPPTAADPGATVPPPVAAAAPDAAAVPPTTPVTAPPTASAVDKPPAETSTPAPAATPVTKLDEYIKNTDTKQFSGTPITIQLRDADVVEVLRLIGEVSGFNILVGNDVRGTITLSLVNVPWDQALDVVLHTMHLGAERNNNLLRIVTLSNLTAEKQQELQAKQAVQASSPRVTRVFSISYADPAALQTILSTFGSQSSPGASGGLQVSSGATVLVDQRTNQIVVQDLPENIERMRKLIELLDTQTPQVMIEAKIIEATESFSRNLGGNLGLGAANGMGLASFGGANPIDPLVGTPGIFASGSAVGGQATGGTFGMSLNFIPGLSRLNAILNIGEQEEQVKVVSAPKTVVLNKRSATIVQGTPVIVPTTQILPNIGPVTTNSVQNANLNLSVTPTVTNDGSVLMRLSVQNDVAQLQTVAPRSMSTEVLVESGSTLVIGGIYTMRNDKTSSGFPFLRKIPLLGVLFGTETDTTNRSELFIFITPRILNEKEAGLSG